MYKDIINILKQKAKIRHSNIIFTTYRLQLNHKFTFYHLQKIVPYLARLGISHVYLSPIFKAASGSMHGYNIIDYTSINPELGGEEGYNSLCNVLNQYNIGQILDFVPNHMGIENGENELWNDVLKYGKYSSFDRFFDINWQHPDIPPNRLILPILANPYYNEIRSKKFKLVFDEGFFIIYDRQRLPVNPATYQDIVSIAGVDNLPDNFKKIINSVSLEKPENTAKLKGFETKIARLYSRDTNVKGAIKKIINNINNDYRAMSEVISKQYYYPVWWKLAARRINYRRFFDINTLAGIRVEDPFVFEYIHKRLFDIVLKYNISGLRIDHPDGLANPINYLERLQIYYLYRRYIGSDGFVDFINYIENNNIKILGEVNPFFVIVEKILSGSEMINKKWRCEGSVGYDIMKLLNGIFVNRESAGTIKKIYAEFASIRDNFVRLVVRAKYDVISGFMNGELNWLFAMLRNISAYSTKYREIDYNRLLDLLKKVLVSFNIYRTYIGSGDIEGIDYIKDILDNINDNSNEYSMLYDILVNRDIDGVEQRVIDSFVVRLEQILAPVMAKGLEDTAFYRYNALISLNEVGGEPNVYGISSAMFHRANQDRLSYKPYTLCATSTHDTKRSEDVRNRISVLSYIPNLWASKINKWHKLLNNNDKIDKNTEYMIYQTLLGIWEWSKINDSIRKGLKKRLYIVIIKAVKEAKLYTSWLNTNYEYEEGIREFIDNMLNNNDFLSDFIPFANKLSIYGIYNTISMLVLKYGLGIADIYQGNEILNYSLVDPDNRHIVNFKKRDQLLNAICEKNQPMNTGEFALNLMKLKDSQIKLYLTYRLNRFAKEYIDVILNGSYIPVKFKGKYAKSFIGFERHLDNKCILFIAVKDYYDIIDFDNIENKLPLMCFDNTIAITNCKGNFTDAITGIRAFADKRLPLNNLLVFTPALIAVFD